MVGFMEFIDILKSKLYISSIFSVVKSQRTGVKDKKIVISGRHSDAFVFVISGTCRYECRGSLPFVARGGDIIYLSKGAEYTMIHELDGVFSCIFCDFEFNSSAPRLCALVPTLERTGIGELFYKLLKTFSDETPLSFAKSLSILYKIYSEMILLSDREYLSSPSRVKAREIKSVIDARFTDPSLSVEALARDAGISEVYLRKLFNSEFGTSPSQYIIAKRISNAEALMKEKTLSTEECAKQSGFSSLQYFCRIFKTKKGFSPGKSK